MYKPTWAVRPSHGVHCTSAATPVLSAGIFLTSAVKRKFWNCPKDTMIHMQGNLDTKCLCRNNNKK